MGTPLLNPLCSPAHVARGEERPHGASSDLFQFWEAAGPSELITRREPPELEDDSHGPCHLRGVL